MTTTSTTEALFVAEVVMTVSNLSFDAVIASPELQEEIATSMKTVVAEAAGVDEADVLVRLSRGSVIVTAEVRTSAVAGEHVTQSLDSASSDISRRAVEVISEVPGIETATDGELRVSEPQLTVVSTGAVQEAPDQGSDAQEPPAQDDTPMEAGIGGGVAAAGVAIGAICACYWVRRTRRQAFAYKQSLEESTAANNAGVLEEDYVESKVVTLESVPSAPRALPGTWESGELPRETDGTAKATALPTSAAAALDAVADVESIEAESESTLAAVLDFIESSPVDSELYRALRKQHRV